MMTKQKKPEDFAKTIIASTTNSCCFFNTSPCMQIQLWFQSCTQKCVQTPISSRNAHSEFAPSSTLKPWLLQVLPGSVFRFIPEKGGFAIADGQPVGLKFLVVISHLLHRIVVQFHIRCLNFAK